MDESCFSEPAFLPFASVAPTRSRKLPWQEIRVINANFPAKCALQFLIGHTGFLIRVQDIRADEDARRSRRMKSYICVEFEGRVRETPSKIKQRGKSI